MMRLFMRLLIPLEEGRNVRIILFLRELRPKTMMLMSTKKAIHTTLHGSALLMRFLWRERIWIASFVRPYLHLLRAGLACFSLN